MSQDTFNSIYVVLQEWHTEHQTEIVKAFKKLSKAQELLKTLYNDDLEWLTEKYNCGISDLWENEYEEYYSRVSMDVCYSENRIEEVIVQ